MKLEYDSVIEGSSFILTDFKCEPAQQLLQDNGYYKIIWSKMDNCIISVDGYDVHLKLNQVLFTTTLNVLTIPKKSELIAVVFNREFYCIRDHDHEVSCNGMLFFGSTTPIITLGTKELAGFENMFSIFKEEFETRDDIQGEMLRTLLKRLLIKSTRLVQENNNVSKLPKTQTDLIRKFHTLVEQHYKENHQVNDYADMLFKSPKTLSNVFKKSNYPSPLKIINDRIILEAQRLLLFSEKNIEQISYELGYKEAAHFSKFFKLHCNVAPGQFKENHIKKRLP